MKINYNILWLDDKMDEILEDDYLKKIYSFLEENGFEPKIDTVKNEKDFFDNLNDSYDLILTDYHLNDTQTNTRNGDSIIEEVRNRSIFTEIMFYSAQGDLAVTLKKDRITFFDTRKATGNVHYEKIVEKAISLIDLTIKKFQHIVAMRGMIMNETSSLDVDMQNLLLNLIAINGDDNAIQKIKQKFLESNIKLNNKIEKITDNKKIVSEIGSTHRWRAISRIMEDGQSKEIFKDYENDIISIRNKFAHAILLKDEGGREYFKNNEYDLIFNEDLCKKIRKDIIKHRKNLDKVNEKINALKNNDN